MEGVKQSGSLGSGTMSRMVSLAGGYLSVEAGKLWFMKWARFGEGSPVCIYFAHCEVIVTLSVWSRESTTLGRSSW